MPMSPDNWIGNLKRHPISHILSVFPVGVTAVCLKTSVYYHYPMPRSMDVPLHLGWMLWIGPTVNVSFWIHVDPLLCVGSGSKQIWDRLGVTCPLLASIIPPWESCNSLLARLVSSCHVHEHSHTDTHRHQWCTCAKWELHWTTRNILHSYPIGCENEIKADYSTCTKNMLTLAN